MKNEGLTILSFILGITIGYFAGYTKAHNGRNTLQSDHDHYKRNYDQWLKWLGERNTEIKTLKQKAWDGNLCLKCGGYLGLRANAIKQCNVCKDCP